MPCDDYRFCISRFLARCAPRPELATRRRSPNAGGSRRQRDSAPSRRDPPAGRPSAAAALTAGTFHNLRGSILRLFYFFSRFFNCSLVSSSSISPSCGVCMSVITLSRRHLRDLGGLLLQGHRFSSCDRRDRDSRSAECVHSECGVATCEGRCPVGASVA